MVPPSYNKNTAVHGCAMPISYSNTYNIPPVCCTGCLGMVGEVAYICV